MEFRLYLQMLRRSWWIIFLTAFSALIIALGFVYFATPIYRASTLLIVSPNIEAIGDENQYQIVSSLVALDKRSIVGTYAEILNSGTVYNNTLTKMGLGIESMIDYEYFTVVLPDANILELAVEGPNPATVTVLANSLSQSAVEYISDLYTVYDIDILDAATQPIKPVRPQPVRDAALAFTLGLLLGAVLAIVREQLRTPLEALLERTQVDGISQAYNRRYFTDQLDSLTGKSPDILVALGLVKLDGLSNYLTVLPQPVIQQLLRQITAIMRKELRGNDIIGRWDDVTFSIMLPDTPGKAAYSTLGRVQMALSTPMRFSHDGEVILLSPKVGIGERLQGDGATVLVERAEGALDEAEHDESGLILFKTRALIGF
ncbi:MAG: diguanylate cyclase [Chloroflexi bacterium]|jgi:diguanylate cyclase (GGDEF)-like protein|nr:diguanylate cyclase [Chloroflexota bacterium]